MFADIKNHWKRKSEFERMKAILFDFKAKPYHIVSDAEYDKDRINVVARCRELYTVLPDDFVGGAPLRVDVLGGNLVRFTNPS